MSIYRKLLGFAFIVFDVLIALLVVGVIFIILTGGKIFFIGATQVRLQGIENPVTLLYFLTIIRYLLYRKAPFLGIVSINIESTIKSCHKLCKKIYLRISSLEFHEVYRIVLLVIGISLIIKIFTAYHFFGFFSGDDVEIHEMTFSHLFDWGTKAWNLRSPFFPMVFIYPIQAVLLSLGVHEPFYLIFAGRTVVVLFSVLNLYLVFVIATRLFNSMPVGLLSMLFLALSKLHTTMGSTELPRTVASTFILLSFWLILQKKNYKIFIPLAGVVLAVGASMRYGEAIFIVAACLYLIFHKRLKHAVLIVVLFIAAYSFINYVSDNLYWGKPFFSLFNIIDYTIVKRESTRGFQPLFYYILSIGLWSNFFSFGFMLLSFRQNLQKIWIWVATPILFLSLLPHKEPRYLLPVIPFFSIMVGLSVWSLLEKIYYNDLKLKIRKGILKPILVLVIILVGIVFQAHKDFRFSYLVFLLSVLVIFIYISQGFVKKNNGIAPKRLRTPHAAAFLLFAFLGVFLFEVNGFFFQKSESGVEMARFLSKQQDNRGVAVEEMWRTGGRLYLWKKPSLENIDQSLIKDRKGFVSKIMKDTITWVGIRDKNVKQYGYDDLLNNLGFTEIKFSKHVRLETYRLFKKENLDSENSN